LNTDFSNINAPGNNFEYGYNPYPYLKTETVTSIGITATDPAPFSGNKIVFHPYFSGYIKNFNIQGKKL